MSVRGVIVNDPPAGVTDTGLGMTFAFERSVNVDAFAGSAGVDEQATAARIVAEAIMATRVFSVFKGRLINDYTVQFSVSAGYPAGVKVNDFDEENTIRLRQ